VFHHHHQIKVAAVGCNPLHADTPLNLIEQLNQTFRAVQFARRLGFSAPDALQAVHNVRQVAVGRRQ
jgi:hypothetical protein